MKIYASFGIVLLCVSINAFGDNNQLKNLPPAKQARIKVTDRVWPEKYGEGDIALWKDDKLAVFSVTIDDNTQPDHEYWLKLGDKYGSMYGQERDTAKLNILSVKPDIISFKLSDKMDDNLFDYPLTVKIRLNPEWKGINAKQAGKEIKATIIEHNNAKFALVQAVPNKGDIILTGK